MQTTNHTIIDVASAIFSRWNFLHSPLRFVTFAQQTRRSFAHSIGLGHHRQHFCRIIDGRRYFYTLPQGLVELRRHFPPNRCLFCTKTHARRHMAVSDKVLGIENRRDNRTRSYFMVNHKGLNFRFDKFHRPSHIQFTRCVHFIEVRATKHRDKGPDMPRKFDTQPSSVAPKIADNPFYPPTLLARLTPEHLGKKLSDLLIYREWSQADLGRKSGLTRANIHTYIMKRAQPSAARVWAMAKALSVDPEWLVPGYNAIPEATKPGGVELKVRSLTSSATHIKIDREVSLATASKIIELLEADQTNALEPTAVAIPRLLWRREASVRRVPSFPKSHAVLKRKNTATARPRL